MSEIGIPVLTLIGTGVTALSVFSVAVAVGVAWGNVRATLLGHAARMDSLTANIAKSFDELTTAMKDSNRELRAIAQRFYVSEGREQGRSDLRNDIRADRRDDLLRGREDGLGGSHAPMNQP